MLRERTLSYASGPLGEIPADDAAVRAAFDVLLDRCLSSRWILCHTPSGVSWLPPSTEECGPDEMEAAHQLAVAFGDQRVPLVDGFVRQLVGGRPISGPFLAIRRAQFQPWDVVRISASAERLDALAREVAGFARSRLEQLVRGGSHAADPWLFDEAQGAISEPVRELCERLSNHATAIAPVFVTRTYDIRVEPREPVQWHSYGDRRVRLALVRRDDGKSFDLAVAGSGLVAWSAFAVEEAMRPVDHELDDELEAFFEEHYPATR